MLTLLFLLLGLPLAAHGGEGLSHAARNPRLTTLTCDQFMREPPRARWLRVTGCQIDYTHPAYREAGGAIAELFFPMRLRLPAPPAAPVSLLVATRDPQALEIARQTVDGGLQLDEEAFTVAMLRVVALLRASREVDGYARSGTLETLMTRRALSASVALAPDAIVLDLHARPSLVRPAIETAAGLILLLVPAALRSRRPIRVPVQEAPLAAAPASPVLERRLPPALLLNLEPSASLGEIEFAPPLGTRDEVLTRLSGVAGPLVENAPGKYSIAGEDWALEFELGEGNEVWTATVHTRGSDAALDALDRVARETNWRVFVPRLGTFRG